MGENNKWDEQKKNCRGFLTPTLNLDPCVP